MIESYYKDGAAKVKVGDQKEKVPAQLAWLDNALAASSADWKFVSGYRVTGNVVQFPLRACSTKSPAS